MDPTDKVPNGAAAKTFVLPTAEQVFRDHAPRVYNLARRMLGNDADAEDVTQDVLLQVVRKLGTFRGDANLTTWLHRVTVNAALAHRRKRVTREHRETPDPLEVFTESGYHAHAVKPWSATPDRQALKRETTELIEKAIRELPELYRDVYVLADVEGLPNQEIGEMLGLSLSAVKSRLHRGRLLMRDALAPHFEEAAT
jgi:RNA polymerase sigma-70 factor (ECF subfamily)